jgi:hypothetical protein
MKLNDIRKENKGIKERKKSGKGVTKKGGGEEKYIRIR